VHFTQLKGLRVGFIHLGIFLELEADLSEEEPCLFIFVVFAQLFDQACFGFVPLLLIHVQFGACRFCGSTLEPCGGHVREGQQEEAQGQIAFHENSLNRGRHRENRINIPRISWICKYYEGHDAKKFANSPEISKELAIHIDYIGVDVYYDLGRALRGERSAVAKLTFCWHNNRKKTAKNWTSRLGEQAKSERLRRGTSKRTRRAGSPSPDDAVFQNFAFPVTALPNKSQMISKSMVTRLALIRFFLRIEEEAGSAKGKAAASRAEEAFREREERLKTYFDSNESPLGLANTVLKSIAGIIDDRGVGVGEDGQEIRDESSLDIIMRQKANDVLNTYIAGEMQFHQRMMKHLTTVLPQRTPGSTTGTAPSAETLYWKFIARWEEYFKINHCAPERANATALIRRLARRIDADGVLRDRDGREVESEDAFAGKIARHILCERSRHKEVPFEPDIRIEGHTEPEVDQEFELNEENVTRNCRSRCLGILEKQHKSEFDLLVAYEQTMKLSDKTEREKAMERVVQAFKKNRRTDESVSDASEEPELRISINSLRVNVCRCREKLMHVHQECVRLCIEKNS
jgi:hypothetical protein